ncbi:hypothetical protein E2562_026981 [Oryza meyeriana var. granulata]|uniref:Uncharacterized protein n=1 Tax=Oryza meyeriana var. granulata TaxID=110450 RepID=A0A6G1EPN9_9ORYZ|nr:hypothetical protein E2562_026981 [Oryza meyeriana var. granulata]
MESMTTARLELTRVYTELEPRWGGSLVDSPRANGSRQTISSGDAEGKTGPEIEGVGTWAGKRQRQAIPHPKSSGDAESGLEIEGVGINPTLILLHVAVDRLGVYNLRKRTRRTVTLSVELSDGMEVIDQGLWDE